MTLFVLKEAKDHIIGKEKLGDTRAETKAKKAKTAPKRSTTINKAIEEGKNSFFLSTPPPKKICIWFEVHCGGEKIWNENNLSYVKNFSEQFILEPPHSKWKDLNVTVLVKICIWK